MEARLVLQNSSLQEHTLILSMRCSRILDNLLIFSHFIGHLLVGLLALIHGGLRGDGFIGLLHFSEKLVYFSSFDLLLLQKVIVDGDGLVCVIWIFCDEFVGLRRHCLHFGNDTDRIVLEGIIGYFLADLSNCHEATRFDLRNHL